MIVTKEEVKEFSRILETKESTGYELFSDFFVENPHLLVATHFDEYLAYPGSEKPAHEMPRRQIWRDFKDKRNQAFFRDKGGRWLWLYFADEEQAGGLYLHSPRSSEQELRLEEAIHKLGENLLEKLRLNMERFGSLSERVAKYIPYSHLFKKLEKVIATPPSETKFFISPKLWTPFSQSRERLALQDATSEILQALWREQIDLREVSWRQLEDVVAELLRDQGMEIHTVRESPQGGRDVIARGELIPGADPLTIAIEVKQREVVTRPDLSKALHDNRYFPALLLATAGTFSAGVIRERALPENHLRLFLKDGVALKDLILFYGRKRRWRRMGGI